jgi:hypothetical protein
MSAKAIMQNQWLITLRFADVLVDAEIVAADHVQITLDEFRSLCDAESGSRYRIDAEIIL